ncbi:MAG: GTPase [Betaproteobacteria bacterium]|nr:GTPase [Betaproteobacteria bacterium]
MVHSPTAATNRSDAPGIGVAKGALSGAVQAYRAWRAALAACIGTYRDWLGENELEDAQASLKLARLAEQLMDDRLVVAFVAENSNDRSDLIDALFFSNDEGWQLPTGAGRVPLFPNEVHHDKDLDTPDLKTIGAESVLTQSLLDSAHSIVIVLRADTDLAVGDRALWSEYIANTSGGAQRRLAVLTITDELWDERRPEAEIEGKLGALRSTCADILALPAARVFAVSLQTARRARVSGDSALLEHSRLPGLERVLATELVAARHSIMANLARAEFDDLVASLRARLETRRRGVLDQLRELEYLRGKNRGLIASMTQKIRSDREDFEQGLTRFQALRVVFSAHTDRLYTHLDLDAISENWQRTRKAILRASFTSGMRSAMSRYFRDARSRLERSAVEASEITDLMTVMYRKFSQEHGLRLSDPVQFSMQRYLKEIDRIEAAYTHRINTLMTMLTNDKPALMQKYFETLAGQVVRCYEYANREVDVWLRAIMAPMETQVREHQLQIRRRLESIRRIHQATDTLEQRIGELAPIERTLREQMGSLARFSAEFAAALEFGEPELARAAAGDGASPFSAPSPSGADTSAATPPGSRGAPD